jgi:hypothetical protein
MTYPPHLLHAPPHRFPDVLAPRPRPTFAAVGLVDARLPRLHHHDVLHAQRARGVPPHDYRLDGHRVRRDDVPPAVHVFEEQRDVVLVEGEAAE